MSNTYHDIVLADKPIMFLPLNDASGSLVDITGNGHDAQVFGTLARNDTFRTVDGVGGIRLGTTRGEGWAICQKGIQRIAHSGPWSIEFWYANTAAAHYGVQDSMHVICSAPFNHTPFYQFQSQMALFGVSRISTGSIYNSYLYLGSLAAYGPPPTQYVHDDNAFRANSDDRAALMAQALGSSGAPPTTALTHVVITRFFPPYDYTNSNTADYINALFINGNFLQATNPPSYGSWMFGNENYGLGLFVAPSSRVDGYLKGQCFWMSQLAVYDYALSSAQVLEHYQAGTGALSGNRVAGNVLLDGFAVPDALVTVHRRDTGAVIGRATTDALGAFSCRVGSYSGQVYAVCLDSFSGRNLPAQVFDLITPDI